MDPNADWSLNFARMMGFDNPLFTELLRLYLTIHCDHEACSLSPFWAFGFVMSVNNFLLWFQGGNVSAHTCHLVGSALSDPYLSFSAAMCGLAGPLHGLACQEVLMWIMDLVKSKGKSPSDDQVIKFAKETMDSGKVSKIFPCSKSYSLDCSVYVGFFLLGCSRIRPCGSAEDWSSIHVPTRVRS